MSGSASSLPRVKCFTGGRGEDLEVFLTKFQLTAGHHGWTNKAQRAAQLPMFLEGQAFVVWNQLRDRDKKDDKTIASALRSAFGLTPAQAYSQFVKRILRVDESVDVYVSDLRRLLATSGHMETYDGRDPLLLEQFLAGLPPDFALQLRMQLAINDLTLAQCVGQVRTLRASQSLPRPAGSVVASASGSRSTVTCYHCKQPGHRKPDCPQRQRPSSHKGGNGSSGASGSGNGGQSGGSGRKGPKCFKCQEPASTGCLAATVSPVPRAVSPLPRIIVDVVSGETTHEYGAAIDSCSTQSFVAAHVVSALNLDVSPCSSSIVSVTGDPVPVLGSVSMRLGRHSAAVQLPDTESAFLVVDDLASVDADVLLGVDIISGHGGVVLQYDELTGQLCRAQFGSLPETPSVPPPDSSSSKNLSRHVTISEENGVVRLDMSDGTATFNPADGYWEIAWRWSAGNPPKDRVGSGLGEYSRKKLSEEQEQLFRAEVQMWIDQGWLVPHDAEVHGSPIAVLPLLANCQEHKLSTPVRPCLDYRALNQLIVSNPGNDVPVCPEKIREWRQRPSESTVLDIRKAYLNIRVHPSLLPYQTVLWQGKTYVMERMGFGLSVAPKLMDAIVKYSLRDFGSADNFIDDIVVPCNQADAVADCLTSYGLPTKPAVPFPVATILGLQLSADDSGKLSWRRRQDVDLSESPLMKKRDVFKWCGKATSHYPVASWLRPLCSWMKRLACATAAPWDQPLPDDLQRLCEDACKRALQEDPVHGVWSAPAGNDWSVWCDASDIAYGCVLNANGHVVEDQAWLRKEDDRRHINVAELDAAVNGLSLAAKWNLSRVTLYTDSKTVYGWLSGKLEASHRVKVGGLQEVVVQRRLQILDDMVEATGMSVSVQWVPSAKNLADRLTRVPSQFVQYWKTVQKSKTPSVSAAAPAVPRCVPLSEIAAQQQLDSVIHATIAELSAGGDVSATEFARVKSQLTTCDGIFFRTVKLPPNDVKCVPVVPVSLCDQVVSSAHESTGHSSWETTYQFLRSTCYFPCMAEACQRFVQQCPQCAAANAAKGPCAPPTRAVIADGPWDVVQVDTLELGGGNSYHCVLVCVDTFTKWVEVVPLRHHDAASVAHALVSVCARWGPPRLLRSDNGTEFVNAITDALFSRFGISVQRGAIRHPQSQGSAERFNRTLLTLIRKVLTDAADWRAELDLLLYHYRIRSHAVTKIPPMHAMCGWTPRDLIVESVTDPVSLSA
ncbi:uncharacterized protein LOC135827687 [Sycon ciliatum]